MQLYCGIRSWLKQVCELGIRPSPSFSKTNTNFIFFKPFTGARSLAVLKVKSFLPCSSVLSSITISQNHFIIGLSGVKPFACIATSLRSWKLRNHYPHISCSKSSESKRALRTGKSTILLNPILKEAS